MDLGGGKARSWDPGRWVWEMAARWSSENVVVEFRDSQVSWGPDGAFWACALLGSLPPLCQVRLSPNHPGRDWRNGQEGGLELSDPSGRVGALKTTGGGWGGHRQGFGVPHGSTGRGICLGTPKLSDCARVNAEGRLPTRVVREEVLAPRGQWSRLVTLGKSQNFSKP